MIQVVGALIKNGEQFLIAQRNGGPLSGLWEFPGGKNEDGESDFDAIRREIREELNLEIEPVKVIDTFYHTYDFGDIALNLVECRLDPKASVNAGDSHIAVEWVDATTALTFTFAPLDKKIIKYILKL